MCLNFDLFHLCLHLHESDNLINALLQVVSLCVLKLESSFLQEIEVKEILSVTLEKFGRAQDHVHELEFAMICLDFK